MLPVEVHENTLPHHGFEPEKFKKLVEDCGFVKAEIKPARDFIWKPPNAKKGETLIIVARKAKEWGFGKSDNKNIIIYGKEEAQSFSLSKKSKEEIIDFLTK